MYMYVYTVYIHTCTCAYIEYYAFLQQAVVRIVREKYLNQANSNDKTQFQNFLSELYVFLSDEMHAGLNKVCST